MNVINFSSLETHREINFNFQYWLYFSQQIIYARIFFIFSTFSESQNAAQKEIANVQVGLVSAVMLDQLSLYIKALICAYFFIKETEIIA